jgi:hypothetical protein
MNNSSNRLVDAQMKVLTDGQVREIHRLILDIHNSDTKIDTDAIAESIRDVIRQAQNVKLRVSC